jgi:hypothetical protein
MSRADKRAWLAGLLSSSHVGLMGDYFDPEVRARATLRLRAQRRDRAGLAAQPLGATDASGAGEGQRPTGK